MACRVLFLLQIPVHLLMILWVLIGRAFFGAGGWYFVLLLFYGAPLLLVGLGLTTAISYRQRNRPRRFTNAQVLAHVTMWAAMAVFGFFLVDFGDTEESAASAFTQVFGESAHTIDVSHTVTWISVAVGVFAWLGTLVLALNTGRGRESPAEAVLRDAR